MRIGEHEVVVLNRDKVKVGCQEVTKAEIEAVLEKMKADPMRLIASPGPSTVPGSVWVVQREDGVIVAYQSPRNGPYHLLSINSNGITRIGYCGTSGLPVEGSADFVKINNE